MTDNSTPQRQASAGQGQPRLVIIVLILLFCAPLLSAWLILNYTNLGNDAEASHGDLYQPARSLPDVALNDPLAEDTARKNLHGDWSMLYISTGACDETCQYHLYSMRQIRLAVSRYARNLQRVWMTDLESEAAIRNVVSDYEGTLVLPMNNISGQIGPGDFAMPPVARPFQADCLYVIDPRGNLVLRYRTGVDPEGIISDLKRLLKSSRIADA